MQDILTSIKSYLYDRAASPLIGAFFVAWSVWNYRFFVIIISSDPSNSADKFDAIDKLFEAVRFSVGRLEFTISGEILNGLLVPTALTAIYLFLYPLLAKPVYEHSLKKQKELRTIKQEQENQRLLSVEESREIYRRLAQMQSKHQEEIDHYNNQIKSLNEYIERMEPEISEEQKTEADESDAKLTHGENENLAEHDEYIRDAINAMGTGRFRLNQLFGQEKWSSLSVAERQSLGKRFRQQVERGDFVGVSMSGKDSGNQQVYVKSNSV